MGREVNQPMPRITLSQELHARMTKEAAAQGMAVDQLVLEVLTSYMALRRLNRLSEYGRKQADTLGLTEEGVPRLIGEIRRET